jgi:hypothetical protein
LEETHVVTPIPKRKRNPYGGVSPGLDGLELNTNNMGVDEVNNIFEWAIIQIEKRKLIAEELAPEGLTIFYKEYVTLHYTKYDKQFKKLHIKRFNMKDKKVTRKWSSKIEVRVLKPSRVLNFHQAMGEALAHSIIEHEVENERLKKRVRELEVSLIPNPLFSHPLPMIVLEEFPV